MSLFLYYIFHSFVNQIKKLFRSWVAIVLLICLVVGLLCGICIGLIGSAMDSDYDDTEITETEEAEDYSGMLIIRNSETGEIEFQVEAKTVIDLVAMGLSVFLLVFLILMADKSNIFLPADAVLLFTAPIKPQKVLLFRVLCGMGAALLGSFYVVIQLLNLAGNCGGGALLSVGLILAYIFILIQSTLVMNVFFIIETGNEKCKRGVRFAVYAVIAATAAALLLYTKSENLSLGVGALKFFTATATRFVPFIGWPKAVICYIFEENYLMSAIFVAANIALIALELFVISRMKADFYEPALARSEEYAQKLESGKNSRYGLSKNERTEDRSEKIKRNGFDRGSGANVFFFKAMYNRKRFAFLGFFTKTFGLYAVLSVGLTVILKVRDVSTLVPGALIIAAIAFYRTLANPLGEDTSLPYFRLIPAKPRAKIFWSLLGGVVNTVLDVTLPLAACAVISGAGIADFLCHFALIITLDIFATCAAAFIAAALPNSSARPIQQIFSIMFISFGFMPCLVIIAIMAVVGMYLPGLLVASALNLAIGFGCFSLLPIYLS